MTKRKHSVNAVLKSDPPPRTASVEGVATPSKPKTRGEPKIPSKPKMRGYRFNWS